MARSNDDGFRKRKTELKDWPCVRSLILDRLLLLRVLVRLVYLRTAAVERRVVLELESSRLLRPAFERQVARMLDLARSKITALDLGWSQIIDTSLSLSLSLRSTYVSRLRSSF